MHLISGLGALMVFPICVKPALMVHFRTFDSLEDVGILAKNADEHQTHQHTVVKPSILGHHIFTNKRRKRGLPRSIADVLRMRKPVMKVKHYGIYQRKGGYSTALTDFTLMRPTNVRSSGDKMPITVRLCTLILVTTNCIASLALGYDEALLRDEERTRRSLPGAIADILRTAKPVMKMKNYGIYERKGGYSTASADFILMRPTDVRLSGNTMFGKVEGRNVMLYRLGENTRMNIWTNKKLTDDTEAWLRINYID